MKATSTFHHSLLSASVLDELEKKELYPEGDKKETRFQEVRVQWPRQTQKLRQIVSGIRLSQEGKQKMGMIVCKSRERTNK